MLDSKVHDDPPVDAAGDRERTVRAPEYSI